jgi:hypothetical protein
VAAIGVAVTTMLVVQAIENGGRDRTTMKYWHLYDSLER